MQKGTLGTLCPGVCSRKSFVISVIFAGIVLFCAQLWAQYNEPVVLAMADMGAYSIIERSDWRRYNNGRYVGLAQHEVRASIVPRASERDSSALLYQGNFFVLEQTLRNMSQSAQAIDEVIPVRFELQTDGTIYIEEDNGYPTMRGFPTFPTQSVTRGFKWIAPGSRVLDPFNTGSPVVIPIIVEYEYRGIEEYRGMLVHRIYAVYASRYQSQYPGANGFSRVQGSHKVDILIRVEDGLPLFMRDDLDETFTLTDGSTVQFRGFTLTFGEGSIPLNRVEVITNLERTLHIEKVPDPDIVAISPPTSVIVPEVPTFPLVDSSIDLTPVPEGIRLTVRDIRFVADSADFLPAERPRLDLIAEALKQIPDRTFLVEGHTAAIGTPESEMQLSIERARRMVDELIRRGISADRFIYKGWGGTKPVGDNSTDSGRSSNRRVEITILE